MGSLGADSASLMIELSTKPRRMGGVNYLAEESMSKITQNSRSQLSGRGVDFAESMFLLAKLAESIFRDVMNLKF